tara:strand:- start:78 stop:332 length:255 start_codon:yes stop_codon:yes gene_type:complete
MMVLQRVTGLTGRQRLGRDSPPLHKRRPLDKVVRDTVVGVERASNGIVEGKDPIGITYRTPRLIVVMHLLNSFFSPLIKHNMME